MPTASAARCKIDPDSDSASVSPAGYVWVVRQLTAAKPNISRVVARAVTEPEIVAALAAGFEAKAAPVKFGSAKALWLAAEKAPESLYPLFDFLVGQLDNPNSILRWNATRALACLARADRDRKLDAVLDKYLRPISGPQMIAAANVIAGAPEIALARPDLADRLARAILGVRDATYKTDECRNVAIGHAIQALDRFFDALGDQTPVVEFVRAQTRNSRPSTRRKAQEFLKRHASWKRR